MFYIWTIYVVQNNPFADTNNFLILTGNNLFLLLINITPGNMRNVLVLWKRILLRIWK